jgi:hypothetical protein
MLSLVPDRSALPFDGRTGSGARGGLLGPPMLDARTMLAASQLREAGISR